MHDTDRIPVTPGVAQRGFTERSLPDTPVARFGSAAQDRQYIVVIGADDGGIAVEKIEYAVPSAAGLQAPGQFPGNPGSAAGVCGQNSPGGYFPAAISSQRNSLSCEESFFLSSFILGKIA